MMGYMRGMGLGGWLTNYKRVALLPEELRKETTVGDREHFETYITKFDAQNIKSLGADHVRLAFDQIVVEDYDRPFHYIDAGFGYILGFLDACAEVGLNVILNCHKAVGAYCDSSEAVSLLDDKSLQDRFVAMWEEFERRFHDYPAPFEILNEVSSLDAEKWNALAERTLRAIRRLNPSRHVIIGAAEWNRVTQLKNLRVYGDKNVSYTYHFYDPDIFTHQRGVLRPRYAFYNRKISYPGPLEPLTDFAARFHEREYLYEGLDYFDERFIEKNLASVDEFIAAHPEAELYFGEFGTIRHMDITSRENWMRDLINHARARGIGYCAWNYLSTPYDGNRFSLVTDDERKIVSERMRQVIYGV